MIVALPWNGGTGLSPCMTNLNTRNTAIGFTVVPKCCVNLFAECDKLSVLSMEDNIKELIYLVRKCNSLLGKRYEVIVNLVEDVLHTCSVNQDGVDFIQIPSKKIPC